MELPPRKIPKTSDKDESSQELNSTVGNGSEYEKEDTPTSESETITKSDRVDPTFDVSFKKLCSKKEVVISLLNTFLSLENKIVDIDFISTEDQPELIGLKSIRFDIICKDEKDSTFIVEMQRAKEPAFVERTLFYWSRIYAAELKEGKEYSFENLKPVIILAFVCHFQIFPKDKRCIHRCYLKDENSEIVTKNLQITYVELSKFENENPKTLEEQWLHLFKFYHTKGEINTNEDAVKTAYEVLKSFSKSDFKQYYHEIQSSRDVEGQLKLAKEEGIAIGQEKAAIGMIKLDFKPTEIMEILELPKEKVEEFYLKHSKLSKEEIEKLFEK
jgi:predicted transposase/invertase (TIGR01784 family)